MKNLIFSFAILLFAFSSCKKEQSFNYTSKMGGSRIWHGHTSYSNASGSGTSVVADTFAVGIINNSTVSMKGYTLHYVSGDVNDSVYSFSYSSIPIGTVATLNYYVEKDSMYFYQDISISASSDNEEFLSTK